MLKEGKAPTPNTGFLFNAKEKKTNQGPDFYGVYTDESGKTISLVGWQKQDSKETPPYIKLAVNKFPKTIL